MKSTHEASNQAKQQKRDRSGKFAPEGRPAPSASLADQLTPSFSLATFSSPEVQKEETRQYIKDSFIPQVQAEIEDGWKEWAARPYLPEDYYEEEPWEWDREVSEVPVHNDMTSEEDLRDSICDYMLKWLGTRSGEWGLGDDLKRVEFWDNDHDPELEWWADELESAIEDCASREEWDGHDRNTTLMTVLHRGYGPNLEVGFYYYDNGQVDYDYVASVPYTPDTSLKNNWQEWATNFRNTNLTS